MNCCGAKHAWDEHEVERQWMHRPVRCLVVGENPGDTGARYFYSEPLVPDRVVVRKNLLVGLYEAGVLTAPTLCAFRAAGFVFDHAIRCRLPARVVDRERRMALRYASVRAEAAAHLRPLLLESSIVWAMGYIALNAVAVFFPEIPRRRDRISESAGGFVLPCGPLVFVSRYLTRISEEAAISICKRFVGFAGEQGIRLA